MFYKHLSDAFSLFVFDLFSSSIIFCVTCFLVRYKTKKENPKKQ